MDVTMPKMGESINEGTVIKWYKKVGDKVKRDEIIFEISTDKVDTEIPSPADGILKRILVHENETVQVGELVAVIEENENSVPIQKDEEVKDINVPYHKNDDEEINKEQKKEEEVKNVEPVLSEKKHLANEAGVEIISVAMPKMGESIVEGTVTKWYKKPGDKIKKDEILLEISTDKVDTEIPSPVEGIILELLVKEQETVNVGEIIAKIGTNIKTSVLQAETEGQDINDLKHEETIKESAQAQFSKGVIEKPVQKIMNSGFISPLVMNIMKKENVSFDEINKIQGTGTGNRVTKKDILQYIEQRGITKKEIIKPVLQESLQEELPLTQETQQKPSNLSESGANLPDFIIEEKTQGDVQYIPMDNIRQKIMQHMINSRDTAVHVTSFIEVDVSKIYNFIKNNREKYQNEYSVNLTYMSFISYAAVRALREYSLVNSSIAGNNIVVKKYINLGIAVALEPNGLIVPNIKNADEKNVTGLAKAIKDIASRARNKKLSPEDITNGTFTITNYGLFGTIWGTPIINQPESAILGIGAVTKKPVVVEVEGMDSIAIKPVVALTLAHDHRLIDGMLGGKFLKFVKDTLENFDFSSL